MGDSSLQSVLGNQKKIMKSVAIDPVMLSGCDCVSSGWVPGPSVGHRAMVSPEGGDWVAEVTENSFTAAHVHSSPSWTSSCL